MRGGPHLLRVGEPLPPAARADADGLVAVGGTLEVARVLSAYRRGIFPWPLLGPDARVLWFSPDPRFVVEPRRIHVGRTVRRLIERRRFRVTGDLCFGDVLTHCARVPRRGQAGTWITPDLERCFGHLHRLGFAHSVEVWSRSGDADDPNGSEAERLVGGLYGLALGRVFFGESMFSVQSNASKVAFAILSRRLADSGYRLIDCQQETEHLARFGAGPMARDAFVERVVKWADEAVDADPWSERDWA